MTRTIPTTAATLGRIERSEHGAVTFSGRPAVDLFALTTLRRALELEIRSPGLRLSRRISALKAAKQRTGLKTNDRRTHLARVLVMIEEARARCVTVVAGSEGAQ